MTAKEFKEIEQAIHQDLKITRRGNCFRICEKHTESCIKQVHFCFGRNDSVFILKQDEIKHSIKFFTGENYATDCCCDSVLFKFNQKEGSISVYLCEIKSSCHKEHLQKAKQQFKASRLFIAYLIACYHDYYQKDISDSVYFYNYYLYPSPKAKKIETRISSQDATEINFRPLKVIGGCVHISANQIHEFFKS
ncbi:hypothetical protein [Helicobacter felis]|nr:hypothetical protein [Helicobacter felis]